MHVCVCVRVYLCVTHGGQGGGAGPVLCLYLGGQAGVGPLGRRELRGLDDAPLPMLSPL